MTENVDPVPHIRHLPITEQMKYCFARYVWPRRLSPAPRFRDSDGNWRNMTWQQLWEFKHKEGFDQYIERMKKELEPYKRA